MQIRINACLNLQGNKLEKKKLSHNPFSKMLIFALKALLHCRITLSKLEHYFNINMSWVFKSNTKIGDRAPSVPHYLKVWNMEYLYGTNT